MNADLLVLDQLNQIPSWLLSQKEGILGRILVIPNEQIDTQSYEKLLQLKIKTLEQGEQETIGKSALSHPFFEGVFSNKTGEVNLPVVNPLYGVEGFTESIMIIQTTPKDL